MYWGVSKSGSPAPNPMTSMPLFIMALALASIISVGDGAMFLQRFEICRRIIFISSISPLILIFICVSYYATTFRFVQ